METRHKYHKIKLEDEDISLNKIKHFLNHLNKDYQNFMTDLESSTKEWDDILAKNKDKKKILFQPEKTLIKSPITIIDAPWGMGKTRFIEEVGKSFIRGDLDDYDFFNNIIIMDTWKFCNYDDVVNRIIYELAELFFNEEDLKSLGKENNFCWNKIKSSLKSLIFSTEFNYSFNNGGESKYGISLNFQKFENNQKNSEDKEKQGLLDTMVKDKLKNPPKTLIFFDNIERLGSFSWEIIKLIQRLSTLKNFIIIFPMDKDKLKVIDFKPSLHDNENGESYIEKYIQLKYYKLVQGYQNILKNFDFHKEYILIINTILTSVNNDKFFSIREVEKIFQSRKIKESFDRGKYTGLKELKKIFNPIKLNENRIDSINNLIKQDIWQVLNFKKNISEWYDSFLSYIMSFENSTKVFKFCHIYYKLEKKDKDLLDERFVKLIDNVAETSVLGNLFYDWSSIPELLLKSFNSICIKKKSWMNEINIDELINSLNARINSINIAPNQLITSFGPLNYNNFKLPTYEHLNENSKNKNILSSKMQKYKELKSIKDFLIDNPIKPEQLKKIKSFSSEYLKIKEGFLNSNDKKEMWSYIKDYSLENDIEISIERDALDLYVIDKIFNKL